VKTFKTSKMLLQSSNSPEICVPPELDELTQDADEPGTTHKQIKPEKATGLSRLAAL
jgi:hypothetical protein